MNNLTRKSYIMLKLNNFQKEKETNIYPQEIIFPHIYIRKNFKFHFQFTRVKLGLNECLTKPDVKL